MKTQTHPTSSMRRPKFSRCRPASAVPVQRRHDVRPGACAIADEAPAPAVLSGTLLIDSGDELRLICCELGLADLLGQLPASGEFMISGGVLSLDDGGDASRQAWFSAAN